MRPFGGTVDNENTKKLRPREGTGNKKKMKRRGCLPAGRRRARDHKAATFGRPLSLGGKKSRGFLMMAKESSKDENQRVTNRAIIKKTGRGTFRAGKQMAKKGKSNTKKKKKSRGFRKKRIRQRKIED